jgi:8-oxo-dGTP pyrophosphatase MutT (NUDIX family)
MGGSNLTRGMADRVISAAGGVVARQTAAGREFLVIHRRRYGDWCLPKGKLKTGETPEQAALREVREETGYDVELADFLGEIQYTVKGVPKTVRFWNMRPVGHSHEIEDRGEVQEAVWLSGEHALARLDYPLERKMLELASTPRRGKRRLENRC